MSSKRNNRKDESARRNNASSAHFSKEAFDHPFAEGGFRWVAKGKYTRGARKGEPCVGKWFKTGHVVEARFFDPDIKAMKKALAIVHKWNGRRMIDKMVKVNIPEVWNSRKSHTKVLVEPFILNYQKFNSNSGWADNKTHLPRVMQALSHFSYHVSAGEVVLCDLQGGVYDEAVVLTDPVILSRSRSYGITDLGKHGISSFFANHRCNEYCCSTWKKPTNTKRFYRARRGTSMIKGGTDANQYVPTHGPTYKRHA